MKFLLFGGSGFVGKRLEASLKESNAEVKTVSRSAGPENFAVDISNAAEFRKIDFIPDVIINCASRVPRKGKSSQDPEFVRELFTTNVLGGLNITNWAVSQKVPKIINCSTLVVVKKPWPVPLKEDHVNIPEGVHVGYALSKLSQEQIMTECVKDSTTNILHLRLSAVYGLGMVPEGVIFDILEAAKRNEDIFLKNALKNFVDFLHVDDVCRAIERIAKEDFDMERTVMNLASGTETSIQELAETIKEVSGSSSTIINSEEESERNRANISIENFLKFIRFRDFDFRPLGEGLREIVQHQELKRLTR